MVDHFAIGLAEFRQGRYHEAAEEFLAALEDDPDDPRRWSYLGMALAHLGQGAEAEAALNRAVTIGPEDGESWFHLGVARSLRSEWPEAVSAFRRAVGLLPRDMVAWHRLGVALSEAGDREAASLAFERALVLSREDGRTSAPALGAVDDHLDEAGARAERPEAETWLSLALSLLRLGDSEGAVAAYERAYTIDPERARRSMFRPMMELLAATEGINRGPELAPGGEDDEEDEGEGGGRTPPRPQLDLPRPSGGTGQRIEESSNEEP
jgi:tetratricopeptide (TPR) repeat protein